MRNTVLDNKKKQNTHAYSDMEGTASDTDTRR